MLMARRVASFRLVSLMVLPSRAASAALALSGVAPTLVSAMLTLATVLPFICSITAVAAVAKSPVLRLSFW